MHKLINVALKDITRSENSRQFYDSAETAQLMTSLRQRGQLQPVGVRPVDGKKGKYDLVFGNRRFAAADKLDWKTIQAVEVQCESDEDFILVNAEENMQRVDVSWVEQGRLFEKLVAKGWKTDEIGAKIGLNKKSIQRCLSAYQDIPKHIRPKVVNSYGRGRRSPGKGKLSANTAIEVMRVINTAGRHVSREDKNKLYEYAIEKGLGARSLVTLVGSIMSKGHTLEQAKKLASEVVIVNLRVPMLKANVKKINAKHGSVVAFLYKQLAKMPEVGLLKIGERTQKFDADKLNADLTKASV